MIATDLRSSVAASYGKVSIAPPDGSLLSQEWVQRLDAAGFHLSVYTWSAADSIAERVPRDFEFQMLCASTTEGMRRFIPVNGSDGLISSATVAGLAIQSNSQQMDPEMQFGYRVMSLLQQKATRLREHLERNFAGFKDLSVPRSVRQITGDRDVLPWNLGLTYNGKGRRWGIEKLIQEGRVAAEAAGHTNPRMRTRIEHGLFAAAKRNPAKLESRDDVKTLLRLALYEPPTELPSPEQESWITERLLEAIEKHQRDSQKAFDTWFSGSKNSLIQQIAKRKCPHGRVNNEMVRSVLLNLGWNSYEYAAQCIEASMKSFRNGFPEPLTTAEREEFDLTYLPQSYLAGLPFFLVHERIPFLKAPYLAKMRGDNNFDFVGVVHRLLNYYQEMANKRRPADVEAKRYSLSSTVSGRSLKTYHYDEAHPVEDDGSNWVSRRRFDNEWDY